MPALSPRAQDVRHCPTCTCEIRRRYVVDPELLGEVVRCYEAGGIEAVRVTFDRSRSQAYRLVRRAHEAMA